MGHQHSPATVTFAAKLVHCISVLVRRFPGGGRKIGVIRFFDSVLEGFQIVIPEIGDDFAAREAADGDDHCCCVVVMSGVGENVPKLIRGLVGPSATPQISVFFFTPRAHYAHRAPRSQTKTEITADNDIFLRCPLTGK